VSRLPFDPEKIPPRDEPKSKARRERKRFGSVAQAEHLTVSQLSELIKATLEQRISSPLHVVGQVSNLSQRNHWYFSLKDEQAVVSCVAWASSAKKFGFTPADGEAVLATGHVSHFPPQGRTQLYVTGLKPIGAGALQKQFEAMCAELRELGYFDPDHKQLLPILPRRIAVITSAGGAAVQDVIDTAARRCPAVGLVVVDVRVQGKGAAEEVARAIRFVDRQHAKLGVEAILVTRGGGSMEDLWAFNERVVADAAYACELPLVAAIGHESDTTVIELVADVRAATPTQAAMLLIPDANEMMQQVRHLDHRLTFLARDVVDRAAQRLDVVSRHALFRQPRKMLDQAREGLDHRTNRLHGATRHHVLHARAHLQELAARLSALRTITLLGRRHERIGRLADRLHQAVRHRIDQSARVRQLDRQLLAVVLRRVAAARNQLDARQRELAAVDPQRVLERGFSVTTDSRGQVITSVAQAQASGTLRTILADGTVESVVEEPVTPPRRVRQSPRADDPDGADQMDLFDGNR
jgi:exodeoxyribonuclease VII large subunit